MLNAEEKILLKNPLIVEEIKRHLWIESEKAGRNIGFDRAAEDWIKRFSKEWLKYHGPEKKKNPLSDIIKRPKNKSKV